MLVWGSGGKSQLAGDAGMRQCHVCGQTRPFQYQVNYVVRHIWYLIRWSTGRTYFQICTVCRNGLPADKAEMDARNLTGQKQKDPIPVFDRFGWAMALGGIALFLVFAVIAGNSANKEAATIVAAPKVGDIYTIDVDKLGGMPEGTGSLGGDYGAFRVSSVSGDSITLDMPKLIYNRAGGVRKDISRGATASADYYDGQMQLPLAKVKQMHQDRTIRDVDR
jgi:hypothetical protein